MFNKECIPVVPDGSGAWCVAAVGDVVCAPELDERSPTSSEHFSKLQPLSACQHQPSENTLHHQL